MNIAVTGLNATDNPGPGVPVLRSLKEADSNFKITGLIYDTLEPGIYMENAADRNFVIPYPSSGLENYFQRIKAINEKNKIDLIIPNLDSELFAFIKLSGRLAEIGIKTYLPTLSQLEVRSKDHLFDFCTANDISVPKNLLASSYKDFENIREELKFPVLVKGIFYEAYIAHNIDEVIAYFNKVSSKWGLPVIIQQYIQGDEFNVTALGDGTGRTIGAVAMRKLYITDKGKGWSGITIDDQELIKISNDVIAATKWKSGCELEFIKSKQDDKYYLLEINPRFPAWIYLATAAGQNMPKALVDLANNLTVTPFNTYETGKIFVRCSWDLITDIKKFEKISTFGEL